VAGVEAPKAGSEVSAEKLAGLGIAPGEWDSVFRIARERPLDCAYRVLTRSQFVTLLALLVGVEVWLIFDAWTCLTVVNGLLVTFYLVLVLYKLYLVHLSLGAPRELKFSAEEVAELRDEELPSYTILVPLYREQESVPRLIEGLKSLDYPKDKLQALLLLEEDDPGTIEAVRAVELPAFISPLVTPNSFPKTKPKACNLGLARATGEYLVIYDAEDRPDPDQVKKAVLGFRRCGPEVVCIQAKLNFYNQRQNLLTRTFTLEYSMWFDLFLPGIGDLRAPIPLGGTSNHFRTAKLRELMGWDPFNVTEDCDLGMRLAREGYETRMLDSTTWEEACSDLGFWVRQRSRWTKGYLQTYLVALRRPMQLSRRVGFLRALGFHLMVAGTPFCLLINPLYWVLTLLWFVFRWEGVDSLFPFPIVLWGLVCLFAGNMVFIYATLLAAYRRGYYDLVKYALLAPVYWLLMSIGAWKGSIQLITRPNYWEKTRHGFDLKAGYHEPAAGGGKAS
jgi:cellulose synthase/poly-beta-1,6-N-acetylglucosamine synthase-like glycosyltransferase